MGSISWQDLPVYTQDATGQLARVAVVKADEGLVEALAEYRAGGSMVGYWLANADGRCDSDTGPHQDAVDWSGFPDVIGGEGAE